MAKDCREELIGRIKSIVGLRLDSTTASQIVESISIALADFEVTERSTEIVVRDDRNDRTLRRYIACLRIDGKSELTIRQYALTLRKFSECIGKLFDDVGTYDIRYFLAMEKERGISNRTLETTRANLSAFFQWLTQEEIVQKNPCLNIKPIKYTDEKKLPFSDTEIDALRGTCLNKKERAIIEMLLSTGMRVSELINLDVSDIDMTERSVRIRHGKGDKERITYATPVAIKRYQEYLADRKTIHPAAFLNRYGERITAQGIRDILKRLGERANVTDVHPHRFRRTMATGLAARGMDVQEVSKLLGHANLNTTMVYVYTDDKAVKMSYSKYAV